jgi:hypothetical protein
MAGLGDQIAAAVGSEGLRASHADRFDAVAPLIPRIAPWVDSARFEPITGVMAGAGLTNTYQGQLDEQGRPVAAGVFFAGDAVCTTNPAAGGGVSLGLRQAGAPVAGLAQRDPDPQDAAERFDAWCAANIRPWYEDHVCTGMPLSCGGWPGRISTPRRASRPMSSALPPRPTPV